LLSCCHQDAFTDLLVALTMIPFFLKWWPSTSHHEEVANGGVNFCLWRGF